MKLIFILFSSIIYNFLFSLTPDEIILSTQSGNQDRFYDTSINNCYDLEEFSKKIEFPFYIKYEGKSQVIWLEIYQIGKTHSFIKGSTLYTFSKTWSDENKDWLYTESAAGCNLNSIGKNVISFDYLYKPYKVLRELNGELLYKKVKKITTFRKVTFYFKPKRLYYTSEQTFSKEVESNPIKHKPKPRRKQDDEDPEKTSLL